METCGRGIFVFTRFREGRRSASAAWRRLVGTHWGEPVPAFPKASATTPTGPNNHPARCGLVVGQWALPRGGRNEVVYRRSWAWSEIRKRLPWLCLSGRHLNRLAQSTISRCVTFMPWLCLVTCCVGLIKQNSITNFLLG